jgi:hypothetical protein
VLLSASKLLRHDSLRQLNLKQLTHLSGEVAAPKPELNRPFGISLRRTTCVMNHCVNLRDTA